jgi:hypothetical protein
MLLTELDSHLIYRKIFVLTLSELYRRLYRPWEKRGEKGKTAGTILSDPRENRFCNGWHFVLKMPAKHSGLSIKIYHAVIHRVSHIFSVRWFLWLQPYIGWMSPQLAGLSPEGGEICSRSLVDFSISKSWLWSPIGSDHYRSSIPLADHCECSSVRFQKT